MCIISQWLRSEMVIGAANEEQQILLESLHVTEICDKKYRKNIYHLPPFTPNLSAFLLQKRYKNVMFDLNIKFS